MKKTKYSLVLLALLGVANATETTLDTIEVVSNNKTNQALKNTTANITVVTEAEINKYGYQSVVDILAQTVGINVAQNGGLGQKNSFFMRGLDSGNIVVAIDGMRLNDPSTTNNTAMLEFIPVSNIKQIEIIRGGSSSIWGANASAGVINIITKNSGKDGLNGDVGLSYGSHNTKSGDISMLFNKGKLHTKLLASGNHTDGISAMATTDGSKGEADNFNSKNIIAGVGYDFTETTKASFSINRTDTNGEYDSTGANDSYSNFESKSINYLGSLETNFWGISSTFNASRGEFDRRYLSASQWGNGDNKYNATTDEYSLINSYKYALGKSILGFEYKDINGFNQYNNYAPTEGGFTNRAIFLANTISPIEDLLLEGNIRYDDFNKFDGKTTYKVGAKYALPVSLNIGANYYKSLNAPSVYQLSNVINGTTLKPSLVAGYDLSIGYDKYFTATYFDNKITDNIIYDNSAWAYRNNSAKEQIRGFELSAKSDVIFDMFAMRANYTHLIDMKDESGTPLYNRSKDEINGFVDYIPNDNLSFTLNAQYIGDRSSPFGYPTAPVASGNYTIWGLHATKEFNDKISLSLHLNNLLDKDYQTIYGYNSEGRTLTGKLTYKF